MSGIVPERMILTDLSQCASRLVTFANGFFADVGSNRGGFFFAMYVLASGAGSRPDLIVEVCHPSITDQYGPLFLSVADYMVRIFYILALLVGS